MQIKMKQVTVKESVPWDGPATATLTSKHGELILDTDMRGILARHSGEFGPKRDPMFVPLENVRFCVEYGDVSRKADDEKAAETLARAQEQKLKAELRAKENAPDAPKGVERMIKDPATGEIKSVRV